MAASVDYNIVGESPPFIFSVKDENNIERFLNISGGKIYFNAPSNGKYTITISKGDCVVKNETYINNCSNVSPTPVGTCIAPLLSLADTDGNTITLSVNQLASCQSLEFQYSTDVNFSFYNSVYGVCSSSQALVIPDGNYYIRAVKTCNSGTAMSNVINVVINPQTTNCYNYAACLGIGNDPNYDTYRVILRNITDENVYFLLSNGSVITVYKGSNMGQEIINVSQNCPYVVSNSLNLSYCQ